MTCSAPNGMAVAPTTCDPPTNLYRVGDKFTPWYSNALGEADGNEDEITTVTFDL